MLVPCYRAYIFKWAASRIRVPPTVTGISKHAGVSQYWLQLWLDYDLSVPFKVKEKIRTFVTAPIRLEPHEDDDTQVAPPATPVDVDAFIENETDEIYDPDLDIGDDAELCSHAAHVAYKKQGKRKCEWHNRFAKRSCLIPLVSRKSVRNISLGLAACSSLLAAYQCLPSYDGEFGSRIIDCDLHLGLRRLLKVRYTTQC